MQLEKKCSEAYKRFGVAEVVWLVTRKCNLRCLYCHVDAAKLNDAELTTNESMKVISELSELGVPVIFISGGEPLIREDIKQILQELKDHRIKIVLSCNGLLLDKQNRQSIRENDVWYVAVSIHGPKHIHDRIVGRKGTFEKVTKNIDACRKENIKICVKSIVTEENYQYIPWVVDYSCTEHEVNAFYICDMVSTGRAKGLKPIDRFKWRNLLDILMDKIIEHDICTMDIGAHPSAASYVIHKLENEKIGKNIRNFKNSLEKVKACPATRGFISISPEGDVLPCNFMHGYTVGNVHKSSLKDILLSSNKLAALRRSRPKGYCSSCVYRCFCSGCRAKAFINGDLFGEDPTCLLNSPF